MSGHKSQPAGTDNQFFFEVFSASPIGIAVENLEGQPLFVNPALCNMLGFTEEEMRNKHCVEFSPDEDAKKDWALFEQLRAGLIDQYSLDKRFFRKDGSVVWGHLTISLLNHRPITLVVAMVENIEEKKKVHEELLRAQSDLKRSAAIVESSQDAIVSRDLEGIVLSWNSAAEHMFGYTEAEAVGQPITVVAPALPERRDEESKILDRLKAGERIDHYETVRVTKTGQRIDVSLSIFPIRDSGGRVIGACKIARDITHRKLAENALSGLSQKLIQAQEQERLYIARELHDDISQSLALLSARLQNLAITPVKSEADLRDRITSMLKDMTEITNDVHALSHRLHTSKLETIGLVATMRGFCRELSEQRKVTVDFTNDGVPGDLSEQICLCLFRVLQEGLNNAVKHSGVRTFEVRLERVSDELQLTIRDQGTGFDPGMAMFTTGLGLISMRERVNLVKGRLEIESKPQGGTVIRVTVPIPGHAQVKQSCASG